jgi:hypothetical protein
MATQKRARETRFQNASSNLANEVAQFPKVDGSTGLELETPTAIFEKRRVKPLRKSFIRKTLEIMNPFVWSPAFLFALFLVATITIIVTLGLQHQHGVLKHVIFPKKDLAKSLFNSMLLAAIFPISVFHYLLNFRRNRRGGIIKAYWYASWAYTFAICFVPAIHKPVSQLRASEINQYCFVERNTGKCEKVFVSLEGHFNKKEVVGFLSVKQRPWVEKKLALATTPATKKATKTGRNLNPGKKLASVR